MIAEVDENRTVDNGCFLAAPMLKGGVAARGNGEVGTVFVKANKVDTKKEDGNVLESEQGSSTIHRSSRLRQGRKARFLCPSHARTLLPMRLFLRSACVL